MASSPEIIAEKIEQFIRKEYQIHAADSLFNRSAHLFDLGFIDSVGVVELISFIESTFEIKLHEEDLFSEEFNSIDGISKVISGYNSDTYCKEKKEK